MSHRSDKGWTDIYLFLFRDGPLEITGGRVKNVWCMNFLKEPACLQEFFSRAYDLLFLGITACMIFLDKFPLHEFFFLGIVTPPPVISKGPSLIRRSTDCDHDDLTSIDAIRILGIWGLILFAFGRLFQSILLFTAAKRLSCRGVTFVTKK